LISSADNVGIVDIDVRTLIDPPFVILHIGGAANASSDIIVERKMPNSDTARWWSVGDDGAEGRHSEGMIVAFSRTFQGANDKPYTIVLYERAK
jgi:hypothetical protein